jgi:hypothetical protein
MPRNELIHKNVYIRGQQGRDDEVLVVPGKRQLEFAEQVDDEAHDLVGLAAAFDYIKQ